MRRGGKSLFPWVPSASWPFSQMSVCQEIRPYDVISIDSVKINTSPKIVRECVKKIFSPVETVLSEESPIVVIRQHNLQTCLHNFSHKDLKFQPQPMFLLPQM